MKQKRTSLRRRIAGMRRKSFKLPKRRRFKGFVERHPIASTIVGGIAANLGTEIISARMRRARTVGKILR